MRIAIVTGASSGMGREFVLQIGAFFKEPGRNLGDRKEKRKFRESGRAVPSAFAYLRRRSSEKACL